MNGVLKVFNLEQGYGFATVEGESRDAHFYLDDFDGPFPSALTESREVEFELHEDHKGLLHARRVRLAVADDSDLQPWQNPSALEGALTLFARIPKPFRSPDKREYHSHLDRLNEIALDERWHFGESEPREGWLPILHNYLSFTFVRLARQDMADRLTPEAANIRTSSDGMWATFNTGLVDHLFEPVFALFGATAPGTSPHWYLYDFCVPGQGRTGTELIRQFNPLPSAPKYFSSSYDMLLDTSQTINTEYQHVIVDGIKRDRFPFEFLKQNLQSSPPRDFAWEDYSSYSEYQRAEYLERLAAATELDSRAQRSIKNRLDDAIDLAIKRTRWNYKTAIPQYYPRKNLMSFLVPMCLVRDDEVDVALVVTRLDSGALKGETVFPLKWAYQNARLVCRPDSDWLVPNRLSDAASTDDERVRGDRWAEYTSAHDVNEVVQGRVQNIVDFGVFIDLAPGVVGLIHVSKMRDGTTVNPTQALSSGDEVTVTILNIDEGRRKIELLLGTPEELVERQGAAGIVDRWAEFVAEHAINEVVQGRVQNIVDFGVFIDLAPGVVGLIHVSNMGDDTNAIPSQIVSRGDQVTVTILRFDEGRRKIELLLGTQENPGEDGQV